MLNNTCQIDNHFPGSDECDTRSYSIFPCDIDEDPMPHPTLDDPPLSKQSSQQCCKPAKMQTHTSNDPLEDHMAGSLYHPTDICTDCGFPRASSVCCQITKRHHGTNEPPPSARCNKDMKRHASFLGKIVKKLFATRRKEKGKGAVEPVVTAKDVNCPFTDPHTPFKACGSSVNTKGEGEIKGERAAADELAKCS
ncbi:unnamed protein product [Phytomonas sp. Hart1]|nr:unnamed protein product [Phytomonas sp. Hart1]|eukprot:CCW71951.1 unnamed protein product [Phytomonas sp. isolate Hart1]